MILVSACLLGEKCRYSGRHSKNQAVVDYLQGREYLAVCPEVLGGLPIPRPPAEIKGGRGGDVLGSKAQVYNSAGENVTAAFLEGAYKVAELAREYNATEAILKDGSPSCGVHEIYDGSFSGRKIAGQGVCAAVLLGMGLEVRSEDDLVVDN